MRFGSPGPGDLVGAAKLVGPASVAQWKSSSVLRKRLGVRVPPGAQCATLCGTRRLVATSWSSGPSTGSARLGSATSGASASTACAKRLPGADRKYSGTTVRSLFSGPARSRESREPVSQKSYLSGRCHRAGHPGIPLMRWAISEVFDRASAVRDRFAGRTDPFGLRCLRCVRGSGVRCLAVVLGGCRGGC